MFKTEASSATGEHFRNYFIFPLSYSYAAPMGTVEEGTRTVIPTMLPNMKTQFEFMI